MVPNKKFPDFSPLPYCSLLFPIWGSAFPTAGLPLLGLLRVSAVAFRPRHPGRCGARARAQPPALSRTHRAPFAPLGSPPGKKVRKAAALACRASWDGGSSGGDWLWEGEAGGREAAALGSSCPLWLRLGSLPLLRLRLSWRLLGRTSASARRTLLSERQSAAPPLLR